ncbi:MAG: tetratricopeptide repeat protein, partial [Chitinophagaceae bacterium]
FKQAIDQANSLMNQPISAVTKTRLYKLIAYSDLAEGDSLDAKKNMDTYFKLQDPDKVLSLDYKFYADIMQKLGNDSMQLVYLNKFVDKDTSTNLDFIRQEAKTLSTENNFKAANLWYDKLFKVADTSQLTLADYYFRAFTQYGAAVKGLGSFNKALETWQTFTKRFPDQPSGYYYIGMCQKAEDTTYKGTAIAAFDKYLSMQKPGELKEKTHLLEIIYSYEVGCYATQGDNVNLDATLQKLLTVNPKSPVASNVYANQAYKAAQAKDYDKATTLSNKALQINPNNPTATQVLSYIQQMKAYDAKVKAYEAAKKKSGQQ